MNAHLLAASIFFSSASPLGASVDTAPVLRAEAVESARAPTARGPRSLITRASDIADRSIAPDGSPRPAKRAASGELEGLLPVLAGWLASGAAIVALRSRLRVMHP